MTPCDRCIWRSFRRAEPITELGDFAFFVLLIDGGRLVTGFGAAADVTSDTLDALAASWYLPRRGLGFHAGAEGERRPDRADYGGGRARPNGCRSR